MAMEIIVVLSQRCSAAEYSKEIGHSHPPGYRLLKPEGQLQGAMPLLSLSLELEASMLGLTPLSFFISLTFCQEKPLLLPPLLFWPCFEVTCSQVQRMIDHFCCPYFFPFQRPYPEVHHSTVQPVSYYLSTPSRK
jgi:hypothetical protein